MAKNGGLSGGCQCGRIKIEAAGKPILAANCHCLVCQRLSGSGHLFFLVYPAASVTISGEPAKFSYVADSGKMATRHFCPACGSQLYGTSEQMPGHYGLNAGCLDDTSGYRPGITAYAKRVQTWDHLAEGIPSFPAMPPM
ncbi:MAG: GFA family protein [Aestuariivirgaceae bacterium]